MKTFQPLVLLVMPALMVSVAQSQTVTDTGKINSHATTTVSSNASSKASSPFQNGNLKAKEAAAAKRNEAQRNALANARISAWEGLKSNEGAGAAEPEKSDATSSGPSTVSNEKPVLKKTATPPKKTIHPPVKAKTKNHTSTGPVKTKTVPVKKVNRPATPINSKINKPAPAKKVGAPAKKTPVAARHPVKSGVPVNGKKMVSPKPRVQPKPAHKAAAAKKTTVKSKKVATRH